MSPRKHGHAIAQTPEYQAWGQMISRCYNLNHQQYKNYGARGISVCDDWRFDFTSFLSDMGSRPSSAHSLDRINNNLGYYPENCRWATLKEQNNNTRSNRMCVVDGVQLTIAQAVDKTRLNRKTVYTRLHRGWPIEKALSTPARGQAQP